MQGNFLVSLWKSYLRDRGGGINCVLRLYQEVKKKANSSISYLQKVENALWTEKIEYQTPTKVLVYCSKSSEWWGWNLMFEFFITKIFLLAMDEDKDKLCHWDLHVTQASCCSVKAFDLNDMAILIRYEQRNSWNKRKSILQYHLFIKFTCQIYFFFSITTGQSYLTFTGGLREAIFPFKNHKIKSEILNGYVT